MLVGRQQLQRGGVGVARKNANGGRAAGRRNTYTEAGDGSKPEGYWVDPVKSNQGMEWQHVGGECSVVRERGGEKAGRTASGLANRGVAPARGVHTPRWAREQSSLEWGEESGAQTAGQECAPGPRSCDRPGLPLAVGAHTSAALPAPEVAAPFLVPGLAAAADKGAAAQVAPQHLGVLHLHVPAKRGGTGRQTGESDRWGPVRQVGTGARGVIRGTGAVRFWSDSGHRASSSSLKLLCTPGGPRGPRSAAASFAPRRSLLPPAACSTSCSQMKPMHAGRQRAGRQAGRRPGLTWGT